MAGPLANPERGWTHVTAPLDRAEVEARIGATDEPLELLSGGLSNRNVRIGRDRVLRIFRDPSLIGKEAALMSRSWRTFRSPKVLARGADYLVVEHVAHEALPDDAASGATVGRALAEIHSHRYALTGFLGDDLALARPFPGDGNDDGKEGMARGYGRSQMASAAPFLGAELSARIYDFLERDEHARRNGVDVPVLTHCDFKVSNLHWTTRDELLVLDWEFAWAGSRWIDIGQLMRWHPPEPFVAAFARAYDEGGGILPDDWRRFAEVVDLCGLIGLVRNPAARATDDLTRRIVETIER